MSTTDSVNQSSTTAKQYDPTTCPHLSQRSCEIASLLCNKTIPVQKATCEACSNCPRPQRLNRHTAALAIAYCPDLDIAKIESIIDNTSEGFGTRLSNTLSIFFRPEIEGVACGCSGHKDILDLWTPDYIKKNMDTVVTWLQQEAKTRGLPFSRPLVRILLKGLLFTHKHAESNANGKGYDNID